ncbi:S-layer homology domain-containing protein [Anaerovibrio slackiae]|uniref:S-layer homology domain-containing protein n=2 Tax=Anaerovibrio slackiae TaxID=2652309 RepID=UPI003868C758
MNKKILSAAVAMALAAGISGTAMAAEGSLADVPKDHWSYQAVDQLVKDGIIEGMPDGTYAGDRAISRYEMAVIVARATDKMEAANIADRALIEKMQAEYGSELKTLQADVNDLKEQVGKVNFHGMFRAQYDYDNNTTADTIDKGTNRYYLDLRGDYKVNDNWTVKFQSETNRHYAGGHDRTNEAAIGNGGDDDIVHKTWSGHDGNIQRIWADGYFPNSGAWVSVGRAWRGLGFQNVLFGTESDGVQFGVPIKGTGLTASGFWMASTGSGNKESLYGVGTWGSIGHCVDINMAFAKSSLSKGEINGTRTAYRIADVDGHNVIEQYEEPGKPNARSNGYVISAGVDLAKNVRLIGDYVRTNADFQNSSTALRLNYKGTNLQDPGSFGVYARYIKYGKNGWLAGDDEWGSTWNGTKGWIVGFKYVPAKNVEWETLYSDQTRGYDQNWEFDRKLVRTQVDFHF